MSIDVVLMFAAVFLLFYGVAGKKLVGFARLAYFTIFAWWGWHSLQSLRAVGVSLLIAAVFYGGAWLVHRTSRVPADSEMR